jgi:hypothetical protein
MRRRKGPCSGQRCVHAAAVPCTAVPAGEPPGGKQDDKLRYLYITTILAEWQGVPRLSSARGHASAARGRAAFVPGRPPGPRARRTGLSPTATIRGRGRRCAGNLERLGRCADPKRSRFRGGRSVRSPCATGSCGLVRSCGDRRGQRHRLVVVKRRGWANGRGSPSEEGLWYVFRSRDGRAAGTSPRPNPRLKRRGSASPESLRRLRGVSTCRGTR